MGEIVFRKARPEDAKAMAELEILCFSSPWSQEALHKDLAENPLSRYYVGEAEGRVVAYAGLWVVLDQGHIMNVAVHPDRRRQGVAGRLLEELIERTRLEGLASYTLEVRRSNQAALALYRSFGFVPAGIRKNYYELPTEDALILWLGVPEDQSSPAGQQD